MKQQVWAPVTSKSPLNYLLRNFFRDSCRLQAMDLQSCQQFNTREYRAHILCFDFLSTSWFNGTCWSPSKTRKYSANKTAAFVHLTEDQHGSFSVRITLQKCCSEMNSLQWNSNTFQSLSSKHNVRNKLWKLVKLDGFGKRYTYS